VAIPRSGIDAAFLKGGRIIEHVTPSESAVAATALPAQYKTVRVVRESPPSA
jgi:hypothetical protein